MVMLREHGHLTERGLRILVAGICLGTAVGCVPTTTYNPTSHPSVRGASDGAGMSAGVLYAMPDEGDGSMLQAPYGEGWARIGSGDNQFELRTTPGLGYVGYRINASSAQESSVGFAIKPSMGAGYWKVKGDGNDDGDVSGYGLAPNLEAIISFGEGRTYISPRLGYLHYALSEGDQDVSTGLWGLGGNIGHVLEGETFDVSFELGFQRVASTEENADGAVYIFTPTFGIQL